MGPVSPTKLIKSLDKYKSAFDLNRFRQLRS
jgi:hypothetical protein